MNLAENRSDRSHAHGRRHIQPDEAVDPVTAEILESLAPKRAEGQS